MNRQKVAIALEDFGCAGSGAMIVERALVNVPGVERVYVNAATEMAYVQYDAERCTVAALREAVARSGFHTGEQDVP